ncbi:MAG TPA: winged helix-turn-helix domain-containing protein [Casimicrobiaceae bacterium]|nr:winged helix-turn-helix domain-containing protein [Casimicrobiaceae bacterium]
MSPKRPKPEVRFRLRITKGEAIALGPGKTDLLEAIAKTGSLTSAAKSLGMSYRRAWLLVDTMNQCFREPVVKTASGGAHGGSTELTEVGREIVRRYRHAEAVALSGGKRDTDAILGLLR